LLGQIDHKAVGEYTRKIARKERKARDPSEIPQKSESPVTLLDGS
jgi:hypothetical protein